MRQHGVRFTTRGLMIAVAIVGVTVALLNALAEGSAGKVLAPLVVFCAAALWDTLGTRNGSAEVLKPEAYLFDWCRSTITESRFAGAERDERWGAMIAARSRLIPYGFSFLREATDRLAVREPAGLERADRRVEDVS
jgi:hypothetical protein